MELQTIDVKRYSTGRQTFTEDGFFVKKSLPVLSVVQAIEGSYQISLDGGPRLFHRRDGRVYRPRRNIAVYYAPRESPNRANACALGVFRRSH